MSASLSLEQFCTPINLSYAAALRYVVPRTIPAAFRYLRLGSCFPAAMVALAASNPEGEFIALIQNDTQRASAMSFAAAQQVSNIDFMVASTAELQQQSALDPDWRASFDFIVADLAGSHASERDAVISLAASMLKPNGLLACHYQPFAAPEESLNFLINEYAPELDAAQAKEFLGELKQLGENYFAQHPDQRQQLDQAIAAGQPDSFFATTSDQAVSQSFELMAALLPRGFSFVGDAEIRQNYMELAAPQSAHTVLAKCREHLLYESIKDFVTQRPTRTDIWCRQPVTQTDDTADLFGHFTFGLADPCAALPAQATGHGKVIDLTTALYRSLLELMQLLPITIGDYLQHPTGKGQRPSEVLAALQVLVACGVVLPMRSSYEGSITALADGLRLAPGFNRYLEQTAIDSPRVMLSSIVTGTVMNVPAREALVMQAIDRVGLANSAGVLLLELQRIAQQPELAARIMDLAEPTPELAQSMIDDVARRALIPWHAYGLMAA